MARFLIDANLPYCFELWYGADFLHAYDLSDDMPDAAIWQYAKEHDLIIVSKDADFSDWIMLFDPPPKNLPNSMLRINLSSCMKR